MRHPSSNVTVTPDDLARTLKSRVRAQLRRDALERERVLVSVRATVADLRTSLGFREAWTIGSVAWGDFGVRSDIDIVLEGASPSALIETAELLGQRTGRLVDVLALEALSEEFQRRVRTEGLRVA